MHAPALIGVIALASISVLVQGAWGNVKSWTGTVTIDATDIRKTEFGVTTLVYKASGPFTIADEMMPAGSHMQWPMPNPEAMTDPKRAAAAFDRWQARVTASYDFKGVNEMGQSHTVKCVADSQILSNVAVTINPTGPEYIFQVMAPDAEFKCSDQSTKRNLNTGFLRRGPLELTGPRGEPAQVTNTKTFSIETTTIKVSFAMAPSR